MDNRRTAKSDTSAADGLRGALEEAIRYAEIGEYLYSACAYSGGDGYTEPREYGIEWQWQQSKPDEYGQGMLLAASTAWHKEQSSDGFVTEATKLRAALHPAPATASSGEFVAYSFSSWGADHLSFEKPPEKRYGSPVQNVVPLIPASTIEALSKQVADLTKERGEANATIQEDGEHMADLMTKFEASLVRIASLEAALAEQSRRADEAAEAIKQAVEKQRNSRTFNTTMNGVRVMNDGETEFMTEKEVRRLVETIYDDLRPIYHSLSARAARGDDANG